LSKGRVRCCPGHDCPAHRTAPYLFRRFTWTSHSGNYTENGYRVWFVIGFRGKGAVSDKFVTIHGSKFRIKLLFLAVIFWQPVQYAFEVRFGEAYPLLQLPKFRGTLTDRAGNLPLDTVEIEVSFADGAGITVPPEALLSQVPSAYRQPILTRMFGRPIQPVATKNNWWQGAKVSLFPGYVASRARSAHAEVDAETRRWIEKRLLVLYPDRRASKVRFLWSTDIYHTAAFPITVTRHQSGIREVSLASK
jgi:hypothetical protein